MGRLMVGFPLFHQVPVPWFVNWTSMDCAELAGCTTVNGAYITTSMDLIVSGALEHDTWDRLVIYEHDMIPPLDAFNRIAQYQPEHAVVGSMYFRHEPPHNSVVYVEQSDLTYSALTPDTVRDWCEQPALYPCDAVGFGFTSIARHVLEQWNPGVCRLRYPMRPSDITYPHRLRRQPKARRHHKPRPHRPVQCGRIMIPSKGAIH